MRRKNRWQNRSMHCWMGRRRFIMWHGDLFVVLRTLNIASTLCVDLGPRRYEIAVTSGALDGVGEFARQRCRGALAFMVTDEHVRQHGERVAASLRKAGFQVHTVILPP